MLRRSKEKQLCFVTLTERKTQYYIAIKILDKIGETFAQTVIFCPLRFTERGSKDNNLWMRKLVCALEKNRKGVKLWPAFCRPIPYLAKENKWQPERIVNRILTERQEFVEGRSCNMKKLALINVSPIKVLHYQTTQDLFGLTIHLNIIEILCWIVL